MPSRKTTKPKSAPSSSGTPVPPSKPSSLKLNWRQSLSGSTSSTRTKSPSGRESTSIKSLVSWLPSNESIPTLDPLVLLGIDTGQNEAPTAYPEHTWNPEPHQVPPPGNWRIWILRAGRGAGKTRTGAEECLKELREKKRVARVGIGAPTFNDARGTCAEGPSGLMAIAPGEWKQYNRTTGEAWHVGGGYVRFQGAEVAARWNGPQWSMLWLDELGLWTDEQAYHDAMFGLRLGENPRAIITTTPKQSKLLREIEKEPGVKVTRATTFDNPHIARQAVDALERRYGGTTLGRQELMAEFIDDVDGAMWRRDWLDGNRVEAAPEDLRRVVVAIDPAFSMKGPACETGLCVAGIAANGDYYVLHSSGIRATPDGWARRARELYQEHRADRIAIEMNYGAPIVEETMTRVWPGAPLRKLHASRGKEIRAEPIAALYEQGRVHHVGMFPQVEDQMCIFPTEKDMLKDRLDALVWALTELSDAPPIDRTRLRGTSYQGRWSPAKRYSRRG